nr:type I pullulanase [Bacilli bacterium]
MDENQYLPYLKDDLGANYYKDHTDFVLWAPVSEEVILNIETKKGNFKQIPLKKGEDNSFRISVKGNLLNKKYYYTVKNNGELVNTNDPWGKGTSFNSEYSAVVDIKAVDKLKNVPLKTKMNSYLDSIIYELHIRDFTEDKHSDIEDKRHYLGVVEKGRTTWGGHPAGLDYLKFLGITHVQILPVLDFLGADDANYMRGYNWGYNPISFFALEGSFSKAPEIPQSRLLEFKKMVNELHRNDIRVIIDVVYNHVYEYKNTSWQKLVPNYFFRFLPNGKISESSGCGNDFASEKPMGRKMIVDSLKYLVKTFDVDGFRFDLMGIIDVDTINEAFDECKKIKEDVMFYGEGWNMPTALAENKRASANNANQMPNIGFFNDTFREVIKGATFDLHHKGFAAGATDNLPAVKYVMKGSTVDNPYPKRFEKPHQSINYIECHDNGTIFDKYVVCNHNEPESLILERIKFANVMTMFSIGVPFFHMGQE